jgi:hypothetical protein
MEHDWYQDATHFDDENSNDEHSIKKSALSKAIELDETIEHLYMSIRDYLRDVNEIDLLYHLDIDDVALLLFKKDHIIKIKEAQYKE